MFRQKLVRTGILVAVVLLAAMAVDFIVNIFILRTPRLYTPNTTAGIAILVSTPVGYYHTSQRLDMHLVRRAIAACLAEREQAVVEAEAALERLRRRARPPTASWPTTRPTSSPYGRRTGGEKYTSPSIERAFGYTVAEIMALPNVGNMHPDDVPMVRNLFQTLTLRGRRAGGGIPPHPQGRRRVLGRGHVPNA